MLRTAQNKHATLTLLVYSFQFGINQGSKTKNPYVEENKKNYGIFFDAYLLKGSKYTEQCATLFYIQFSTSFHFNLAQIVDNTLKSNMDAIKAETENKLK